MLILLLLLLDDSALPGPADFCKYYVGKKYLMKGSTSKLRKNIDQGTFITIVNK